ncbi:MucR family transcriptional regulator [Mesorhizobium sp. M0167]|uniref:MucR family transcriptional regulator n=1 Tax=unclassified Mesorhizobium TaxID=325217 RepID=UPI00333D49BF
MEQPPAPPEAELVPAVNPRRSVFPDYIICLGDGKIQVSQAAPQRPDLTSKDYRAKWGLVRDYLWWSPSYAAQRSALSKFAGLGRKAAVKTPLKKSPAKRRSKV